MSKTEEATNDFCTRCFKYKKCTKVQSECTMADSYQEGYEDGYHQAEKDLELTWEDIERIDDISIRLDGTEESKEMSNKEFYQEVLKRFKDFRERKQQ